MKEKEYKKGERIKRENSRKRRKRREREMKQNRVEKWTEGENEKKE